MRNFTAIIAVYNAPVVTELCLNSFFAACKSHLHETIIIDSSDDGVTSWIVSAFVSSSPEKIRLIVPPNRLSHSAAIIRALQEDIQTPYLYFSDSDIEYFSCRNFDKAEKAFMDASVAIAGHYIHQYKDVRKENAVWSSRIAMWSLFTRTSLAKKYWEFLAYCEPNAFSSISYDTGSVFLQKIIEDGYSYHHIDERQLPLCYTHYVGMSRYMLMSASEKESQINMAEEKKRNTEKEIEEKVKNKVWEQMQPKCSI